MSLQGTLKTLGITEVLEFLATRSASGLLDVTTEMGTAAYGLIDGAVVESEYSFIRESGTDAAEATYYVVAELDGTFFFDDERSPHFPDDASDEDRAGEDVPSLLARTAEIAERWIEVEETIPSPNHLLTRNNQLDGSVTIQPEWWKALEMIGEGKTPLQLASALDLSALDASLTALAMTNAGLLIVREVDPLEIEVDSGFATVEETPEQDLPTASPVDTDPGFTFEQGPNAYETSPAEDEEHEVEPVQPIDVVEVAEPTPTIDNSWKSTATPMSFASPEPSTPPIGQAPMSFSNDELSHQESIEMADTAVPDEFAGRSGMDDLSELEYMVEPEGFVSSEPVPEQPVDHGHVPVATPAEESDDDGWSSGHVSTHDDLRPITAAAAQTPEPAPPTSAQPPAAEHLDIASPFDAIGSPNQESAVPEAAPVDVTSFEAKMSLEDLPAPPSIHPAFDAGSASEPEMVAPTPEAVPPTTMPAVEDINAATTAMAGEVIDDLASLSDALDESVPDDMNWQLDGTFVPDSRPVPKAVEGDPFGDLGELLNDTSEDERSSVLKFLRRD